MEYATDQEYEPNSITIKSCHRSLQIRADLELVTNIIGGTLWIYAQTAKKCGFGTRKVLGILEGLPDLGRLDQEEPNPHQPH